MEPYREHEPRAIDLETAAIADLSGRMRTLRKRTVLPLGGAALAAGFLGAAAHVSGYWSILGVTSYGTYLVHPVTILLAFALAALPFVGLAVVVYRLRRAALRRAWAAEHRKHRALTKAWLEQTIHRFA